VFRCPHLFRRNVQPVQEGNLNSPRFVKHMQSPKSTERNDFSIRELPRATKFVYTPPLIVAPTPSTSSSSAGAQKKRIVHVPIIKGWLTGIPEASTPASVAPGLPSGSHPNLRTVSMPQPSSSEQPLITEDVSRSAVASAELTRITEKSSEFQPDSM
jgi:hypothetical protein